MKKLFLFFIAIITLSGLLLGLSACGGKKTADTDGGDLARQADQLIEGFQDIGVDLSGDTFGDLEVPVADMNVPDIDFGSFSINLEYDPTGSIPSLILPDTDSLLGPAGTDLYPDIPEGFVPDDSICAQFAGVPDCSFVPEKYRELCEQCKEKQ